MAKINSEFQHNIFEFLHKPLKDLDRKEGDNFLERFLVGGQNEFEDLQKRILLVETLNDPAKIRADLLKYLKSHVGFTDELNNITNDLGENDLRKLIALAVALWKTKGIEPGYSNIVRLFVGKTARIFNWFDFRMIVGEKAFGEEQLGEDAWLISVPGIEASGVLGVDESFRIRALFPFESNSKDRSLSRNDALIHSPTSFYNVPAAGFPQNSEKLLSLQGGIVEIPNIAKYDLTGDFTVEIFMRSNITETSKVLIHKMDASGKGFKIEINKSTNLISFQIGDGTNTVNGSFTPGADIDDNIGRHLALTMDRANDGARLWFGGSESTSKIALGALGDITNNAKMFIGGEAVGVNTIKADVDSFRLAVDSVYDVDTGTLTVPVQGFIEFQEELLHEFESDIRVVDEGDLNIVLILRILNLMRPSSERLNVIFIRFFDDFLDGIGQFSIIEGNASVNTSTQMQIEPSSLVATSVFEDTEFQNIVLQVKANDIDQNGGVFSILFFFQDVDNYYEYRVDTANRRTSLHKNIAGVSSVIGSAVVEDIVPKASYVYTVITDLSPSTGNTTIKAYVDSNLQHEVVDGQFNKGKFGMKTNASTTMQINEIEMMEIPTNVQRVEPGFDL